MLSIFSIIALIIAYLFGSIPTAVWIGQAFFGIDIREHGSGNAGATNTFRVLGTKAGITVTLLDIVKGWTATNLAHLIGIPVTGPQHSAQFANHELALGIAAVFGHLFPVFAGFRGGKGIATLFGMVLAVHPFAALICLLVFVLVLLLTKYVSLSSILSGFALPLSIIFIFHSPICSVILYDMSICILVLLTHQKNIERLLRGNESKVNIFQQKK